MNAAPRLNRFGWRPVRPALTRMFRGLLRRAPVDEDGMARIGARQIYILPTPTGLLYALAVFVMLLGSLNYQNNLGLLFAFFLASVGLIAMHHCWFNLLGLAVSVRAGPAVFAGSAALFEVSLRNERAAPRYDLRLIGGLDPERPIPLAGSDQRVVSFGRPTTRRGLLPLVEVEIATRHPMHLFRAWCYAQSQASCLVYPGPAVQAPPPTPALGDARRAGKRRGEGADDYLGARQYRSGDSPRHLDWKVFARERGLVIKQFGGDESVDCWVDWANLTAPDLERRISLLTRQVLDAAQGNMRFGLRLPGQEIGLYNGDAHLQRCLGELALFKYGQTATEPDRRTA